MNSLQNRIPPPLVMLLFALLMWGVLDVGPEIPLSTLIRNAVGSALVILGIVISLAGVVHFRHAATTVNPLQPEKASSLVTSGVFRFTRNPMYLGMAIVLLALFVKLGAWLSLLGVALFVLYITRFQIIPEERAMLNLFEGEFKAYQARVRRWV